HGPSVHDTKWAGGGVEEVFSIVRNSRVLHQLQRRHARHGGRDDDTVRRPRGRHRCRTDAVRDGVLVQFDYEGERIDHQDDHPEREAAGGPDGEDHAESGRLRHVRHDVHRPRGALELRRRVRRGLRAKNVRRRRAHRLMAAGRRRGFGAAAHAVCLVSIDLPAIPLPPPPPPLLVPLLLMPRVFLGERREWRVALRRVTNCVVIDGGGRRLLRRVPPSSVARFVPASGGGVCGGCCEAV
ncbi:unnamed protein product, partial [Phaeothamnion confervicola]